jgi:hypothetical protein
VKLPVIMALRVLSTCSGVTRDIRRYEDLTYLLTPWCRILFEKLILTQLVKKYPAFL